MKAQRSLTPAAPRPVRLYDGPSPLPPIQIVTGLGPRISLEDLAIGRLTPHANALGQGNNHKTLFPPPGDEVSTEG